MATHTSHPKIIQRLRRAEGHLKSIVLMLETERPCVELAQQLHAVEKAIANAKRALIHDHIGHSLAERRRGSKQDLHELRDLTKYL